MLLICNVLSAARPPVLHASVRVLWKAECISRITCRHLGFAIARINILRSWRDEAQGKAQASTRMSVSTPPRVRGAQAFDTWRAKHWSTALGIRRLLAGEAGGANEAALVRLVAEAQHELWSYFQLKRAIVGGCVLKLRVWLVFTVRVRARVTDFGALGRGGAEQALKLSAPLSAGAPCAHRLRMSRSMQRFLPSVLLASEARRYDCRAPEQYPYGMSSVNAFLLAPTLDADFSHLFVWRVRAIL